MHYRQSYCTIGRELVTMATKPGKKSVIRNTRRNSFHISMPTHYSVNIIVHIFPKYPHYRFIYQTYRYYWLIFHPPPTIPDYRFPSQPPSANHISIACLPPAHQPFHTVWSAVHNCQEPTTNWVRCLRYPFSEG